MGHVGVAAAAVVPFLRDCGHGGGSRGILPHSYLSYFTAGECRREYKTGLTGVLRHQHQGKKEIISLGI